VCAMYATQVRRGDEIGMGDFGYLSEDLQQAWRLPISIMIDIPRLRSRATSVVTVAEYLVLNGLPTTYEKPNGHWDLDKYHEAPHSPGSPPSAKGPSHYIFSNDVYEPSGVVRVDYAPPKEVHAQDVEDKPIYQAVNDLLGEKKAVDLEEVTSELKAKNLASWNNDIELEILLHDNGWTMVYTFKGV